MTEDDDRDPARAGGAPALRSRRRSRAGRVRDHGRRHPLGARLRGHRAARGRDLRRSRPAALARGGQARALLPQRGRRRPQAAHRLPRARRCGRRLLRRRRPAEPADRRPAGRCRGAARCGAEPGRRDPVGAAGVRDLLRGRGDGPRSLPRPRRRGARHAARLHPALLPVRDPLRPHAQGPRGMGQGPLRPGRAHPGARRRRRGALGRHPHPGGGHADGQQQGPRRPPPGARQGAPASLHVHLPSLRRDHRARRSPRASPRLSPSCTATRSMRPGSR